MSPTKMLVPKFNDVPSLMALIDSIGVGKMGRWRQDETGWLACTPHASFGPDSDFEMRDNIAIYLESEVAAYVRIFKLVLNQNVRSSGDYSYDYLYRFLDRVFQYLELNVPDGLNKAFADKSNFVFEESRMIIKMEHAIRLKTNTYELTIESK